MNKILIIEINKKIYTKTYKNIKKHYKNIIYERSSNNW